MKKTHLLLLVSVLVLLLGLLVACDKKDGPATDTVSLTMVIDDGTSTVAQIAKGKPYTPTEPTRDGYVFGGWYGDKNGTGERITSVTTETDMTVYAKWNKLYELTLDPAGGTLAQTKVSLTAGDVISEKIAALVPEKADCLFGMWLLDGEPLAADAVMGNEDITLVAKYKIKYTIEVFKQNTTRDGYDREADLITEYGYIGDAVTETRTFTGFTAVTKPDSVTQLVLGDDATKNAFRLYFDREGRTLTFASNYPDGSQNQRTSANVYYGVETELPFVTYTKEGYYLEGWSLTPGGKMVYYSHVMDAALANADAPEVEKITPEENVTLYAVWSRGYTDLFGGADMIYVAEGEAGVVYLCRGGRYFKGRIRNSTIAFNNVPADFPIAQLNADGTTFLFRNRKRADFNATLYEMGAGKGLNELINLAFDDANGVTYSQKESADGIAVASTGTYVFDDEGNYVVTFTSGPLAGKTLTIAVGTVKVNGERRTAFQVRNEEEVALGRIYCFVIDNDTIVVSTDANDNPVGDLTLNGFGIAAYNSPSAGITSIYYTYDAEARTITLISQGKVAGVLRLMELNGKLGYMIYNAAMDVTYTLTDGSTLRLNGIRTATYTGTDGVAHSGFFTTATSAFGGTILTFTEDGVTYKFMLTVKTQDVLVDPENPESGTTSTKVTVVDRLSAYYAEYYYKDAEGTYYAPLFVFETAERSTVTVYGRNKEKQYHKIAAGTLTYDATTGLYLLTVTETFTVPADVSPVFTEPVDFSKVKSCALMLNSGLTQYSVHFWFNYNDGVETVDNTEKYTGADGSELTLVSGFAVYRIKGKKAELGVYQRSGNVAVVSFADRNRYFTLDTEAKTFTVADKAATPYYEVGKDGKVSRDGYLVEDPVKGYFYYVVTTDGENKTTTAYHGTQTKTGRTSLTGFPIYSFASDLTEEGTDTPLYSFEYITRDISTGRYFFRYDAAYAGTFRSTNTKDGVLKLDGFGLAATYSDGEGHESYMGMYQKNGDEVQLSASKGTLCFLLAGDTCALRGSEYGRVYVMIDNQVFDGLYAEFDGLGHVTIFRMVKNGEDYVREAVDAAATYTVNGDRATITYRNGAAEHTITVKFGTVTSGSNTLNALHTVHEEVVYAYVNEKDWSVLRLNGDGSATKYLTNGAVETGTYSLITEHLLYYANTSGTQAYIYVYDTERGTATPQEYEAVAYYTTELDSLLFTQYGFAIFNNSVKYYYTVDENNIVTLYYLDENATDKNRYGYVKDDSFGEMSDIKSYGSHTYYKNDGFAINFVRADATKDYYPVQVDKDNILPTLTLTFAPTGGQNFSVSGTVTIGNETYDCTVVRETVDGVSKMYFMVYNFRFDITIHYEGDGVGTANKSTYEVTGLSNINVMPSYTYLYYLYYIYSMMGSKYASQLKNTYGTITVCTVYKQDGSVEERYMNATFGESASLLLSDGTLIEKLEKTEVVPLASGVYRASFTGGDGYRYTMIFMARTMSAFRTNGYSIYALLREETVPANDGYVVTVNRVVASDIGYPVGSYYSFGLTKDGAEVPASNIIMNNGKIYYIVRGEGEGAKTYYYQLTLVEKSSGSLEEGTGKEGGGTTSGETTSGGTTSGETTSGGTTSGETTEEKNKPLPLFESATVTVIEATTAYTADGKNFVDVLPDNKILLLSLTTEKDDKETRSTLLVAECSYDAENGVYTLKTSDDRTFTVTITGGVATITETTAPATTEQA